MATAFMVTILKAIAVGLTLIRHRKLIKFEPCVVYFTYTVVME